MNVFLDILIEEPRWSKAIANLENVAEQVKDATFAFLIKNNAKAIVQSSKPLHINLCFSDDAHVHQLNRDFRNIDRPTNVLSFANLDAADFSSLNELFNEIELGDIIIAYETMEREAAEQQISLHDHFCHLLVHGILHLMGYDHIKPEDAAQMENMEKNILQTLNINNPYEDTDA